MGTLFHHFSQTFLIKQQSLKKLSIMKNQKIIQFQSPFTTFVLVVGQNATPIDVAKFIVAKIVRPIGRKMLSLPYLNNKQLLLAATGLTYISLVQVDNKHCPEFLKDCVELYIVQEELDEEINQMNILDDIMSGKLISDNNA